MKVTTTTDSSPPLNIDQQETVTVRLVLVPASVENRHGKVVRGLGESDFRLWEDSVRQNIEFVSVENGQPVSLAFLLDVSGSMRQLGKIEEAKQAIRELIRSLRTGDSFALIGFADEQVSWITEFTSDRRRFLERLEVQEGYGQTALNDAVAAAPGLVNERAVGRKAIILITDGVDNASVLTTSQAIGMARRVNVPIYAIGFTSLREELRPRDESQSNYGVLHQFSAETGGAFFAVSDPDELKEAVSRIDEDLRQHYLIGYYPLKKERDGGFRQITLRTSRTGHTVRTRKGYYANP